MSLFDLAMLEERGFVKGADGSYSKPPKVCPKVYDSKQMADCGLQIAKKPKEKRAPSPLALQFEALWRVLGKGLPLTPEHRFHKTRKWRFDYAHLPSMVAIEIEGGAFSNGRHTRPQGFINDCEKYNTAIAHGWSVLRLPTGMVTGTRIAEAVALIHFRLNESTRTTLL